MTIRDIAVSFGFEVDRNSEKRTENSINRVKNLATKLLGGIAVVFSIAKIAEFSKQCVEVASNVEEMQNKFDVVFQGMTDEVEDWAESFAKAIGRNKSDIKGYLADNQNMFVGMGMTRDQAAGLSEDLVSLALDLASFNNLEEDQAVNAMSKALMGETESAKTLGAVLNDNTRAMAMQEMALSGTYDSLDEATKMQVNYTAILMQSSDAVGDCARSLDSYKGRQIQLNSAIAELKEFIGGQLLPVFAIFIGWIATGVQWLTEFAKKLLQTKDGENRILIVFYRIYAIVKRLQPAVEQMAQTISRGLMKGVDIAKNVIDKFGGMEQALKIAAIAAGSIWLALNAGNIIAFLTTIPALLKAVFSLKSLGIIALIGVIALILLALEDFVNFLQGHTSVIGELFKKWGIDADEVKGRVTSAWKEIKGSLVYIWTTISTFAGDTIAKIRAFFSSDQGQNALRAAWEIAADIVSKAKSVIVAAIKAIGSIVKFATQVWKNFGSDIVHYLSMAVVGVANLLGGYLQIVQGAFQFIAAVLQGDWSTTWEAVKQIASGAIQFLMGMIQAFFGVLTTIIGTTVGTVLTLLSNWITSLKTIISSGFRGIPDKIKSGMQAGIDFLKGLSSQALQWGSDFIGGFVDGILAGVEKVADAAKKVGETVKSYLHFSRPDVGPLRDYETWMPDMVEGLSKTLKASRPMLEIAVNGIAATLQIQPSTRTAQNVYRTSGAGNTIHQNIEINNTVKTNDPKAGKQAASQLHKSSEDVTEEIKRGLAYGRP